MSTTSLEVIIDVFGYGTDEPTRPLLPPGLCWICSNSPQQEAMKVIDTRRNSRPEKNGQSERIYVCEPCAKELGAAVGQVSAEKHQRMWDHRDELGNAYNDVRLELESVRAQQTRVVSVEEIADLFKDRTVTPAEAAAALDVPPATEE